MGRRKHKGTASERSCFPAEQLEGSRLECRSWVCGAHGGKVQVIYDSVNVSIPWRVPLLHVC
jgi:hypothetical protein